MVQKKNFNNMNKFYHEKLNKPVKKVKANRNKVYFVEFNVVNKRDTDYEITRFDNIMSVMKFCEQISDIFGSFITYFRVWEVSDNECNVSRWLRHKFFNKEKLIEKDFDEGVNHEEY